MMKKIIKIRHAHSNHWVGDGFPVRSLFSYRPDAKEVSPFLLFDYAGPHFFEPNTEESPRGVGQHPHRGFETVTIVYDGEVSHRDSTGGGGTIGPGDVQWMTAGGGIIHEEFHSLGFSKSGGPFRVVQLWVNLPQKDKMTPAKYQAIAKKDIPSVDLKGGRARVIAGELEGIKGPATTYTPVNLWDLQLQTDAEVVLAIPEDHNVMVAVLSGHVTIDAQGVGEAEVALLSREEKEVTIKADGASLVLVLTGLPIDEPVEGYGPFVMNSEAEIRKAIDDYNNGHFTTTG
ncbi:MAG: pirin family protein [Candidatus Nucleicultricaceae bacterium]